MAQSKASAPDPGPAYLGVDIGGTKVAAGMVSAQGKILSRAQVSMSARGSADEGLAAVLAAIEAARDSLPGRTLAGIGVSSPGPLDPRRGVVINPPNLPCWRDFPLAKRLQKALAVPVRLDNDANAAGLAEAVWGAGRGHTHVFYATLGTGIGAALVLDGKIYHGRTGAAIEGGHLSIDRRGPQCACGKKGCIEALASGPAVGRRARRVAATDPRAARMMLQLAGGKRQHITAEIVGEAWRAGDKMATAILQGTAALLAIWMGNIIDLLEPDVVIFGGGMGALMAEWFLYIREHMQAWTINSRAMEIPMKAARYGADAGIAGGAALCLHP